MKIFLLSVLFSSTKASVCSNSETKLCVFKVFRTYLGFSSGSGSFRPNPTGLFSASSPVTRWSSASTLPCDHIQCLMKTFIISQHSNFIMQQMDLFIVTLFSCSNFVYLKSDRFYRYLNTKSKGKMKTITDKSRLLYSHYCFVFNFFFIILGLLQFWFYCFIW